MILASLMCLVTLVWVIRDIILDILDRRKESQEDEGEEEEVPTEAETTEAAVEALKEDDMIPEIVVTTIVVEKDASQVEVVDVIWAEDIGKNKTYRYSPNGVEVSKGDIVLVPTFSSQKHGEIARKATVGSDIYKIDPAEIQFKLKPVLKIIQKAATASDNSEENSAE